jgi:hypothetical protein
MLKNDFRALLTSVCNVLAYFAQYNFCSGRWGLSIDMSLDMLRDKSQGHKSIGFGVSSLVILLKYILNSKNS